MWSLIKPALHSQLLGVDGILVVETISESEGRINMETRYLSKTSHGNSCKKFGRLSVQYQISFEADFLGHSLMEAELKK